MAMRTTVTLPEDVLEAARSYARYHEVSLGDAIAALVRQSLCPPVEIDRKGHFPHFRLPADMPVITTEQVLAAKDEE
jgi:hypothetical protein